MTSTSAAVEQPNPTITVPEPLKVEPRRPATRQILAMTLRASISDRSTWRLPVIAFAVISTIILDVTGGAVMMWHIRGDNAAFYRVTSTIAVVLLILPPHDAGLLGSEAVGKTPGRSTVVVETHRGVGASATSDDPGRGRAAGPHRCDPRHPGIPALRSSPGAVVVQR